jgi:hypothetical protein
MIRPPALSRPYAAPAFAGGKSARVPAPLFQALTTLKDKIVQFPAGKVSIQAKAQDGAALTVSRQNSLLNPQAVSLQREGSQLRLEVAFNQRPYGEFANRPVLELSCQEAGRPSNGILYVNRWTVDANDGNVLKTEVLQERYSNNMLVIASPIPNASVRQTQSRELNDELKRFLPKQYS